MPLPEVSSCRQQPPCQAASQWTFAAKSHGRNSSGPLGRGADQLLLFRPRLPLVHPESPRFPDPPKFHGQDDIDESRPAIPDVAFGEVRAPVRMRMIEANHIQARRPRSLPHFKQFLRVDQKTAVLGFLAAVHARHRPLDHSPLPARFAQQHPTALSRILRFGATYHLHPRRIFDDERRTSPATAAFRTFHFDDQNTIGASPPSRPAVRVRRGQVVQVSVESG